jgi:hypothetical protein
VDGLVKFLRARFDEREVAARAAVEGPWRWIDPGGLKVELALVGPREQIVVACADADMYPSKFDATHIVLNDPAYVLADTEAKRSILDLHSPGAFPDCAGCGDDVPCLTVRLLAAPFSTHPDYDPAWPVSMS